MAKTFLLMVILTVAVAAKVQGGSPPNLCAPCHPRQSDFPKSFELLFLFGALERTVPYLPVQSNTFCDVVCMQELELQ